MSARALRPLVAALLCGTALVACGCNSISTEAQRRSLEALATTKPKPSAGVKFRAASERCKRHPYASLPPTPLPRPGHMPAGTFMRQIQDHGRFVVGVDQNSLGLGYFNPGSDEMEGFDIDLVRQIARAIFGDVDAIRFVALSTAQRSSAIVTNAVDMVASAFSITCERRNRMHFSSVYHTAHQRLLVPAGSKVRRLSDLRGKPVCVTKLSTSLERLRRSRTGVVPYVVDLRTDCLVALQEARVSAVTNDDAILLGFRRQDPQTEIVGDPLQVERYGMAIGKEHPEFVSFVNGVLKQLRDSGCLPAIARHWLRLRATPDRTAEYERCTEGAR